MAKQINIIPVNHSANYKDALAYVDGEDRIGGIKEFNAAREELEAQGLVCINPENVRAIMSLPEDKVIEARVACMWCGGGYIVAYRLPNVSTLEPNEKESTAVAQSPGEETHETSGIVAMTEKLQAVEMAATHKHHPGWCNKCQSYCYGDCEA